MVPSRMPCSAPSINICVEVFETNYAQDFFCRSTRQGNRRASASERFWDNAGAPQPPSATARVTSARSSDTIHV